MNTIIFLFGPSCSGKSSLGEALHDSLGKEWTYIDRDDLVEQKLCTDATADETLEERIQVLKNKIIVDAQIPWREKRKGEFYFLVLPPLNVLIERDDRRTVRLQRTQESACRAREFVLFTHNILNKMDKKDFNLCFDSSQEPITEEVIAITKMLAEKTVNQHNLKLY